MAKLGDVCRKGSSNIAQKDLAGKNGPYPIFGASGFIANVDFYQQERSYIAVVKDGAGVGRVMRLPAKSSVIGTMQYILPGENIDVDYLAFAMEHMDLAKYYSGATIPHIYFKDYQNETLPLPELSEQRMVASVLNKVNALTEKRQEQVNKLDELVKARFLEMFAGEYPIVSAESVCLTIVDCPHSTPKYEGDELIYPAIRTSEIKNGDIDWSSMKYVSYSEYLERTKRLVPIPGDIVYAREGTYGDCVILPEKFDFCLGQRTMLFRPDVNKCTSTYLHQALRSDEVKTQADKSNIGSTVPHVNVADAKKFKFPLPPLNLQHQFALFIEKVDKSKLTIQQSLDKLEVLKKSLMQEYFG